MGVAAAFIFSITFLPAIVSILPASGKREVAGKQIMVKFGEFVIAKQKHLLIGNAAIIIGLASLVPLNELNDTNLGLDVGALSGLIFIISGLTGLYYKKIVRSIGRNRALITQQISYLALIMAVYHAYLNGGLTNGIGFILFIQILMLLEVLISRTGPYYERKGIVKVHTQ